MLKVKNNVGIMVVNYHGKLVSLDEKVLTLDNDKKTPYRLGRTEMTYPDGGKEEILTRVYAKSIEAHPDTFKVGQKIGLEIQAEGEYLGRAVAKLAGNNVNMARLLGEVSVPKVEIKANTEGVSVEA